MSVTLNELLEKLVRMGPGRTERELAQAIYGNRGYQQQVNQLCDLLVHQGRIDRHGTGGTVDPHRYYPR